MEAQKDIAERQLEMQKETAIQGAQGTIVGIGAAAGAAQAAGAETLKAGLTAAGGPVAIALAAAFLFKKLFD